MSARHFDLRFFDVIVFGATSFVGKILCHYLHERFGYNGDMKWAIAGRSAAKLDALRHSLGVDETRLPALLADISDEDSLRALCRQTRVLVTTVGPYSLYGEAVVRACVQTGTDYCDLTGEPQWIRRMLDRYEQQAKDSGARVVHCCGFDSVPSDLGVFFLQQMATRNGDTPCKQVAMRVEALQGDFSGGTLASIVNAVEEAVRHPALIPALLDPYFLCPDAQIARPSQDEHLYLQYDRRAKSWLAPFVMAGINTRVVHRSNALQGYAYGTDFTYDEAENTGDGVAGAVRAAVKFGSMASFVIASAVPPSRHVMERWVLAKPGEGPSPAAQNSGHYRLRFYGQRPDGSQISACVTGNRDPGYGSTARILGEAAACLAFDVSKDDVPGGFWTPSTALGQALLLRLAAFAGLTFTVA